jgi:hypothetical protein
MKTKLPRNLAIVALLSTVGAAPVASAAATMGPMQNAIPRCAQAVKSELGAIYAIKFADRVVLTGSRARVQSVALTGWTYESGARVPFEARCERGVKGRTVAEVYQSPSPTAIAADGK